MYFDANNSHANVCRRVYALIFHWSHCTYFTPTLWRSKWTVRNCKSMAIIFSNRYHPAYAYIVCGSNSREANKKNPQKWQVWLCGFIEYCCRQLRHRQSKEMEALRRAGNKLISREGEHTTRLIAGSWMWISFTFHMLLTVCCNALFFFSCKQNYRTYE